MRTIFVPELADILISELLGSFGDNELSPECLDGAMRFLKREFYLWSRSVATLMSLSSGRDIDTFLIYCTPGASLFIKAV